MARAFQDRREPEVDVMAECPKESHGARRDMHVGQEPHAIPNVISLRVWLDDLVSRVTVAEQLQNEVHCDSEAPDRGLSVADLRIDGDTIEHERMIPDPCRVRKAI